MIPVFLMVQAGQQAAVATAMAGAMMKGMFALNAAISAFQFLSASQAAKAQADWQQKMYDQNKKIADESAIGQYGGLHKRILEEREVVASDIQAATRAGMEAFSTARVSAGEAGVGGPAVTAIMQDFERRQLEYTYTKGRSQEFREVALGERMKAIRSGQQGRILSMLPKPVQEPSFVGAALRIGQGYFDAKRQFSVPYWDQGQLNIAYY
jgi:hypothetical protein